MTMVSKYPLNKKIENRIHEILLDTFINLKSKQEVNEFLDEFLSPTEKIMLAKRLAIGVLLAKDYDFRSISKILKVSVSTVSGVNLWIKHKQGRLKKATDYILKMEKVEDLWSNIDYFLGRMTVPIKGTNWSERRRRVEEEKRSKRKLF